LNDGHTLYFAPQCYGNLVYRQPFNIISYVGDDGNQKIGIASINNASGIPNYYKSQYGLNLDEYVGSDIVSFDGVAALDYVIDFSNKFVGGYKDLGARFNVAVR